MGRINRYLKEITERQDPGSTCLVLRPGRWALRYLRWIWRGLLCAMVQIGYQLNLSREFFRAILIKVLTNEKVESKKHVLCQLNLYERRICLLLIS